MIGEGGGRSALLEILLTKIMFRLGKFYSLLLFCRKFGNFKFKVKGSC